MIENRLDENVEETVRKKMSLCNQGFSEIGGAMVFSHYTGKGLGMGLGSMGSNILCRNVHTCPRQGQVLGPILSYCANPVPSSAPGLDHMQRE